MNPYRPHRLMAVPPKSHAREEIAMAIRILVAEEADSHARQRLEVASLRRGLDEIPRLLRSAFAEWRKLLHAELGKYSPDQPRVPKGNRDGGQWTNDTGTETDAINAPERTRYASNQLPIQYGSRAWTGISQIDDTTKKLAEILNRVINEVGMTHLAPNVYGILIHKRFELAVIAAGIRGISAADVERTFLLPPDYTRAVKPDVVLRDDVGDIIAIYDVKTLDAELEPWRVRRLRAATRVNSSVYVIDLHVERGATLKIRRS